MRGCIIIPTRKVFSKYVLFVRVVGRFRAYYYCRSMYKMINRMVIPDRAITVNHVSGSKSQSDIMPYSCAGGTFQTQNSDSSF